MTAHLLNQKELHSTFFGTCTSQATNNDYDHDDSNAPPPEQRLLR